MKSLASELDLRPGSNVELLHVPNLIITFGTCKVRRLNQLGSADLYLGQPAVLFGRACRIQRQKIDFVSYFHTSNFFMCRI